jgi:hypothetical protein
MPAALSRGSRSAMLGTDGGVGALAAVAGGVGTWAEAGAAAVEPFLVTVKRGTPDETASALL